MTPRIETATEKKLIGQKLTMSYANYRVEALWKTFMPKRKEIRKCLTNDLISMAVYNGIHFTNLSPTNEFERWAAVEVPDFEDVPAQMETFVLTGGMYAVFDYKGLNTDTSIFRYIFETWLPDSDYILDNRPHFEVLGEKYKNNDPASEEEIWIPVQLKTTTL